MSASLLIHRNNQQSGPFTEGQVRQMLAEGSLQPGDMAWREGMAEWRPVAEVLAGAPLAVAAAAPAVAAAGGVKWGLVAGATAVVLALGGVGVWQYQQQQELAAEQQRLALAQQKLAEEQAQEQQRKLEEERRKAEEERQRLEAEKQQAEAEKEALTQKLAEERRQAEAARQQAARQQRVYETRQRQRNDVLVNPPPPAYGGYPNQPPPMVCRECGVVQSVQALTRPGEGSGVGAVAGGVLGGVLGNQVGRGRGRDAATVVGVLGGAVAGHQIEKSQRTATYYQITVRFDDGSVRTYTQEAPPPWRQGDRVRSYNGGLIGG